MAAPSVPLEVTVRRGARATTVIVRGELDIAGDAGLRDTLHALVDEGRPVIVDLAALRFCDVPGIRAIVAFARAAEERGLRVEVRGATGQVDRLLDLTQTRGVLPLAG